MSKKIVTVYQYGVPAGYERRPRDPRKDSSDRPAPVWAHNEHTWAGQQLLIDQLRLANTYRNALADEERQRRQATNDLACRHFPALHAANEAISKQMATIEYQRGKLLDRNKDARQRTGNDHDRALMDDLYNTLRRLYAERDRILNSINPAPIKALNKQRKELLAELHLYTKLSFGRGPKQVLALEKKIQAADDKFLAANPGMRTFRREQERIDADSQARCKDLQHQCGLHWGTYLAVDDAAARFRKGRPPAPNRDFDGCGRIAIQFQGGLAVNDLLAPWPADVSVDDLPPRRKGVLYHNGQRGVLIMPQSIPTGAYNADGTAKRNISYVAIPVVYHRDLPEAGRIKWIHLIRRRTGHEYEWTVSITVHKERPVARTTQKMAVVQYDWCLLPDGSLRAASWLGSDGSRGQLLLMSKYFRRRQDHIERLAARRDALIISGTIGNTEKVGIRARLLFLFHKMGALPKWLTEATDELSRWRGPGRFHRLYRLWRQQRFDGDEEAFELLANWRRDDRRLWNESGHCLRRMQRYRLGCYRRFAAELTGHSKAGEGYKTVSLPGKTYVIRTPSAEDKESFPALRRYEKLLAFAELTNCLKQKATVSIVRKSESTDAKNKKGGRATDNTAPGKQLGRKSPRTPPRKPQDDDRQ